MPASDPQVLYIGSTNQASIPLVDLNGNAVEGATVTITLLDDDGDEVAGQSWPASMAETATPGTYAATLESDLTLSEFDALVAVVVATKGTDTLTIRADVVALYDRR